MDHVQGQEGPETDLVLVRLLKTFLGSPNDSSSQYRAWHRQFLSWQPWRRPPISKRISPEGAAILAMCGFSFYIPLLDWWGSTEIPLLQTNSQGDSLLALAAIAGCKAICKSLIEEHGMQVDMPVQNEYGSALAAAAYMRNIEVVKFLVEKGAEINLLLQTGYYGSALAAAAFEGDIEVVKFLVEEGAEINLLLQTGYYGSALAAAAYMRNI